MNAKLMRTVRTHKLMWCIQDGDSLWTVETTDEGKFYTTKGHTHDEIKAAISREKRNCAHRAANAILRELCGTSAAAARRDMGI